jgi:hypothetical protein
MRNSSARQAPSAEFDFAPSEAAPQIGEPTPPGSAPGSTTNINAIDFSVPADLYAVTARRAGRVNAAGIADSEVENLMYERQQLLDKKFDETMTRSDEVRLKYIQWQLDRIDDAQQGEMLDMLESWVARYEQFQTDINQLHRELARHKRGSRR